MFKDPVCGMAIDENLSQLSSEYQGQEYYFCSKTCNNQFDENPKIYITESKKER